MMISNRGGARRGAGRKSFTTLSLSPQTAQALQAMAQDRKATGYPGTLRQIAQGIVEILVEDAAAEIAQNAHTQ